MAAGTFIDFALVRYKTDGALDASFGTGGVHPLLYRESGPIPKTWQLKTSTASGCGL
jgi:hypothetical protein